MPDGLVRIILLHI